MVFSSLQFIFIFIPLFLLGYYLLPLKWRNLFLFVSSVIFYSVGAFDCPVYILLILASVFVNHSVAKLMVRFSQKKKLILISGLIYNFLWLALFKYSDFLLSNINELLSFIPSFNIPLPNFILPIGISFYTFQAVSYIFDVYKGKSAPADSLIDFGAYLCMFPQLIAGPIVTYPEVAEKLKKRSFSFTNFSDGWKTFILGLGFKVLIANPMGKLWGSLSIIGYDSVSTAFAWLGILGYTLQIYFDFYGYSVMALGLGKMIGFNFPENFKRPYVSVSITEFWRRWHITLGSWFREYLYFPLGGSRVGKYKTVRNLLIVWLSTGLWHGASWNFVIWGLIFFVLLSLEKLFYKDFLEKHRAVGHLYTLFIIPLTWAVFAITDFSSLKTFFLRLFPFLGKTDGVIYTLDFLEPLKDYWPILLIGIIGSTGIIEGLFKKFKNHPITAVVLAAIFWGAVYCMHLGLDDPFLYFRF